MKISFVSKTIKLTDAEPQMNPCWIRLMTDRMREGEREITFYVTFDIASQIGYAAKPFNIAWQIIQHAVRSEQHWLCWPSFVNSKHCAAQGQQLEERCMHYHGCSREDA